MRISTTTSCAPESDTSADSLVIETSEPPQGARVLTDEQLLQLVVSQLTQTELGGTVEGFNHWGERGYDDFVPGEVTRIAPSGDETT